MAVLIMVTSNKKAREQVRKAYHRRGKRLFLGKLAPNVYVMKNDGKAVMWAWKEKKRNPMFVDLYAAEELRSWQIPEEIRRAAQWKLEKGRASYPRKGETLARENLPSMEDLEKIELNFSLNSPTKK